MAVGREFASHEAVNHSADEYVRGDAHTNTVEGFYSIFKRGMKGIYQHCAEHHLHRYLAEYDFRYSHRIKLGFDDKARTLARSRASKASGLPIGNLVKLDFKRKAQRFLRWRKRQKRS